MYNEKIQKYSWTASAKICEINKAYFGVPMGYLHKST